MYDPLMSPDDDLGEDNFIGLSDEAWEHKSSLPLLNSILSIPFSIAGHAFAILRR